MDFLIDAAGNVQELLPANVNNVDLTPILDYLDILKQINIGLTSLVAFMAVLLVVLIFVLGWGRG